MEKKGTNTRHVEGGRIVLRYTRERYVRETWISASAPEGELDEDGITFRIRIGAHESWSTCLDVVPALSGDPQPLERPRYRHGESEAKPEGAASAGAQVGLALARGGLRAQPR
jgi:hypothetical protein